LYNSFFSTIYIENDAREFSLTKTILSRFNKSTLIPINSYKEIFNRSKQDWQKQTNSRQLIIAIKADNYLYEVSDIIQPSEYQNCYYTTPILNCLYNCSYCFLQGLYPSANVVVFVNIDDFFKSISDKLKTVDHLYVNLSYETDLLGFENIFGLNRIWYEFSKDKPNLILETRTKSANFTLISDLKPIDNFIITWTLSPEAIQRNHETKTTSLFKRIENIKKAKALGWKTRICIDPIIYNDDFESNYENFFKLLKYELGSDEIKKVTTGYFRINSEFLNRIKKQERKDSLIFYPYNIENGIATYNQELLTKMNLFIDNLIKSI
jgi:spore photoproduct lyase